MLLFPVRLFPNNEVFLCRDANNGRTLGLFLALVESEGGVDELVGIGVVAGSLLIELLMLTLMLLLELLILFMLVEVGSVSFLSFISSSIVGDSEPVEMSSFDSSDSPFSFGTVLDLSSVLDLTDGNGAGDALLTGVTLFASTELFVSMDPVATSDPFGVLSGLFAVGFRNGNLGRAVEARCEPNKFGF